MGFINSVKNLFGSLVSRDNRELNANYFGSYFRERYNGEKTEGGIGPIRNYIIDHEALAFRSWQAYLDSEIAQIIIKKFNLWVIGNGLKLDATPNFDALISEGIEVSEDELDDLSELIESRFHIYSNSKTSSYSGEETLHDIANKAQICAFVSGDCLIIHRVINGRLTAELIDGLHVRSPLLTQSVSRELEKGRFIRDGIEIDDTKKHFAYYVRTGVGESRRIPANDDQGRRMAFMVYGLRYRPDDMRGIPQLSSSLESITKLDRYKEATVSSAEQRANIPYFIKHETGSTGESIFKQSAQTSFGRAQTPGDSFNHTHRVFEQIQETVPNQVINMPVGSELQSITSQSDLYFNEFYKTLFEFVAAAIGIPSDVALSLFNSNYSASRAAIKDWDYTLKVLRRKFSNDFYMPFYKNWYELQVLTNKIPDFGFLNAMATDNVIAVESFLNANFKGRGIPHIDPLKEANAWRTILGDDQTPLGTVKMAVEDLVGEDYRDVLKSRRREKKEASDLIEKEELQQVSQNE